MPNRTTHSVILGLLLVASAATPAFAQEAPPRGSTKALDDLLLPVDKGGSLTWVSVVEPGESIFPSLVVGQATIKPDEEEADPTSLGDPMGLLGVGIVSPGVALPVRVTVSATDIMEESTFTGKLMKEGETYAISPKIKWKFKELLRSRQQMPVNVTFKVKVGNRPEEERTQTVTLRTINDCPYVMHIGDEVRDTRWMFAAYVNEDHPWVDQLLKESLGTGIVDSFIGYQSGKEEDVLNQVFAIWQTLQKRGIRYSDVSTNSVESAAVASQHVRFLDESIVAHQANCVDGAIMLASVLRRIGLRPSLVFVPGHCYLAVSLTRDGSLTIGLESTVIGRAAHEDFEKPTLHLRPSFEKASLDTFNLAVKVGSENLAKHLEKINDPLDEGHVMISIAEAREIGVRPMPYVPAEPAAAPPQPAAPGK